MRRPVCGVTWRRLFGFELRGFFFFLGDDLRRQRALPDCLWDLATGNIGYVIELVPVRNGDTGNSPAFSGSLKTSLAFQNAKLEREASKESSPA